MTLLVTLSHALTALADLLMAPLYLAVSAVLVGWHQLLTAGLGLSPSGGLAWVLSIVGLTVVVRTALVPLYLRQLRSSRALQRLQPRVQELQRRHGHDRERLAQETMRLYREAGTSPFASCLPLLVQTPIFVALFRLLDGAVKAGAGHGVLTDAAAAQFAHARLLGLPVSASFLHPGGIVAVQGLAVALVLATGAATYLAQRRALPAPDLQPQRTLLTALPVVLAAGGLAFPVGVLCYWTTSSLWTLGQQLYLTRGG